MGSSLSGSGRLHVQHLVDADNLRARIAVVRQQEALALLSRPNGTTITAIMEATSWRAHSVRGFLAGPPRFGRCQ
jgi:hypothetical protein